MLINVSFIDELGQVRQQNYLLKRGRRSEHVGLGHLVIEEQTANQQTGESAHLEGFALRDKLFNHLVHRLVALQLRIRFGMAFEDLAEQLEHCPYTGLVELWNLV